MEESMHELLNIYWTAYKLRETAPDEDALQRDFTTLAVIATETTDRIQAAYFDGDSHAMHATFIAFIQSIKPLDIDPEEWADFKKCVTDSAEMQGLFCDN